ncbi:MAG: TonB-dependent receptor [Bacteroidales bacterium]|nr:TonB-dependent receptor [Bacteroidales bacterium]
MMHRLPKILGNADPLHYVQLLPGVQTNSEYDAGLHVQGCDNMHNMLAIGGVPVYNAAHLLGLFSVFNSSHYPTMSFSKSMCESMTSGRLGGELSMQLPSLVPDSVNGEFAAGVMSSQGTLRVPVNRKSALFVSLRASYLNLLYGSLLEWDGNKLKYGFSDFNATYLYTPNEDNKIWLDFYGGYDDASVIESEATDFSAKWGNLLLAAHHEYKAENFNFEHYIYTTNYKNSFSIVRKEINFRMPSAIYDWGYAGTFAGDNWRCGFSAVVHRIKPQSPLIETDNGYKEYSTVTRNCKELLLHGKYRFSLFENFSVECGANTNFYISPSSKYYSSLNPAVTLGYETASLGRLSFMWDIRHQYILQTGLSSMGLPIEFRLSSDGNLPPQYSQNYTLSYSKDIFGGDYNLSCELYYKRLYNLIEYDGNIFDFYSDTFKMENVLIVGDGENYGLNLMLNKCSGSLTGWLSVAVGRAMRQSPLYGSGWYPANHERLYEFNAVATYKFNDKFDVGATFVAASGTPFTAPKKFYMVNGNLISEYDKHNSNRVAPYSRLDLSMNYTFHRKAGVEQGVNFSIYNALMHKNKIYYRLKFYENKFAYVGMGFIMSILPSVSYYCKF